MKAMERPAQQLLESFLSKDLNKAASPATVQRVHCPTCGSSAERYYQEGTVRTQCSSCDYLMTMCSETGRVIESYAPSFSPATMMGMTAMA